MKYSLLISAVLASSALMAQNSAGLNSSDYQRTETTLRKSNVALAEGAVKGNVNPAPRAGGDVIWEEDFNWSSTGIPAGWVSTVLAGPGSGFVWGNTGPTGPFSDPAAEIIASTTASNGFIILRSDSANDDGNGSSNQNGIDATLVSEAITIPSGVNGVYVQLEQAFRYFIADNTAPFGMELVVLNQAFQPIDTFDLIGDVSVNDGSNNPDVKSKMSVSTAGVTAIYLVLYHYNISNYYWQVDDMAVIESYENDLSLDQIFFNGFGPNLISELTEPVYDGSFYNSMPSRIAAGLDIEMGVTYLNAGINTPGQATAEFTLNGPNGFSYDNATVSSNAPASGQVDSIVASAAVSGVSATNGNYSFGFSVNDTVTDEQSTDNQRSAAMSTNNNTYKWDALAVQFIRRIDEGEMTGAAYKIYAEDTLVGAEIGIYSTSTSSSVGTVISVYLYDYEAVINNIATRIANGGDGDNVDPLAVIASFHEITADDNGGNVRFLLDEEVVLEAGKTYIVAVQNVSGDAYWYGFDDGRIPASFGTFENPSSTNGSGGPWFTETVIPHFRLITKSPVCINNNIALPNDNVDPNLSNYTVLIDAGNPVGGSQPYTFSWSTGESTDTIVVSEEGFYTLTVTDNNGCKKVFEYAIFNDSIGSNLGVATMYEVAGVNIYPNPAREQVSVQLDEAGAYTLDLIGNKGEVIAKQSINVGAGEASSLSLTNVSAGVYTLRITNAAGESKFAPVVVQ